MNRPGLAVVAIVLAASVPAAGAPYPSDADSVRQAFLDVGVPDSPAFAALGISPSRIGHPSGPQELALFLANNVEEGVIHNGVAVDVSPYLALVGRGQSLGAYRASYARRFLSRATLSLGTLTSSSSAAAAAQVAVGVRLALLQYGDPRMDARLLQDIREALGYDDEPQGPPSDAGTPRNLAKDTAAAVHRARADAAARNWNRAVLEAGTAYTAASTDGSIARLRGRKVSLWTAGGVPLAGWGQLLAQVDYAHHAWGEEAGDRTRGVLKLRAGSGSSRWILEGSASRARAGGADAPDDSWGRVTTGFEVRLAKGTWLGVAFGSEIGRRGETERLLGLANLKWALSDDTVLQD